ncbi:MAG: nucleoside-diphosphate sugar epimerase/dehydratase, partial [Halanaerobiales bacterium]
FDGDWPSYFNHNYFFVISFTGIIVLFFSDLYNKVWRYASIAELFSILKSSVLINLVFLVILFFIQARLPRSILIINYMLDVLLIGGTRFTLRILKEYLGYSPVNGEKTRVLLVGAGDAGEIIIREMKKHPELRKKIIGLIDDDPRKQKLEIHGIKVLGRRQDIPQVIKKYGVEEVIIAIPSAKGKDIKDIYNLSKQEGVKVKLVPGMYEILNGDVNLSHLRDVRVEDLLRREQVQLDAARIAAYVEGKVVLVTGAGGSIGSELCRQLARFNPQKLLMLDIYENNLYFLDLELRENYPHLSLVPIIASIRDRDKLDYLFAQFRPEVVFHAAAHKHVPLMEDNPEEAVKNNIFGTKNVIEAADKYQVERFVLISSDKAVNPTNVMGASKRVAEMLIQAANKKSSTKFMAVRFGNVLGSAGSVIPLFKKQIKNGGPVTVTHPEVTRYFMTIPEAVQLVIQAGALGQGGEVFVLDMGEPVKIMDLAKDLIELSGLKVGQDIEIKITGLRPGEKLYEELLNDNENNLATEHEPIFIAKLEEVDEQKLNLALNKFVQLFRTGKASDYIRTLVELVETYQPQRDNVPTLTLVKDEAYPEIASGSE